MSTATKKQYSYEDDIRRQMEKAPRVTNSHRSKPLIKRMYYGFKGPDSNMNTCREVTLQEMWCAVARGDYKQPADIPLEINLGGVEDEKDEIAATVQMMKNIHQLEDELGLSRSKFTCSCLLYARGRKCGLGCDACKPGKVGFFWEVLPDKKWYTAISTLSYYLGELRGGWQGVTFDRERLFYLILKRNKIEDLADEEDLKITIYNYASYGEAVFSKKVAGDLFLQKQFGISPEEARKAMALKPLETSKK